MEGMESMEVVVVEVVVEVVVVVLEVVVVDDGRVHHEQACGGHPPVIVAAGAAGRDGELWLSETAGKFGGFQKGVVASESGSSGSCFWSGKEWFMGFEP
ncbi:unnamed protein product [Boreogadus saida]